MTPLPPDPRDALEADDLAQASRNNFPVVAHSARRSDKAGLVAGGAIALALGALTFAMLRQTAAPQPAAPAPDAAPSPIASKAPTPAPPPLTPAQQAEMTLPPAVANPAPVALAPVSAPAVGNPVTLVYDAPASQTSPREAAPHASAAPAGSAQPMLNENEAFSARLGHGAVETVSATRMEQPALTVAQGTLIPAILETAIDSDLPGYARAVVSQDIRGFDGSRVLIPRGSRLIGQYKSGLQAGQTRVYVVWQRLIRPDGVSVMLASPAIEFSGRSGLSGQVDSHFMKRYSAAILLSILSGAGALAGNGTSVVISSGSQGAASVAAQNDGKVPPTVRVALGQPIRVFTARDLDFASVEP
jgi:type IV secretion system protein VirB10